MNPNRREFIVRSSLAVAAGALVPERLWGQQAPAAAAQPPTVPMFASLRRNVGTFTARGGTMGWLVAPDAVVVIDSQFADTSKMFLDGFKPMIRRPQDRSPDQHPSPPRHTGGNKVLSALGREDGGAGERARLQRKQAACARRARTIRPTPTRRTRPTGKSIWERGRLGAATTALATPAATASSSSRRRTSSTWVT
jgi:hypothetical protein